MRFPGRIFKEYLCKMFEAGCVYFTCVSTTPPLRRYVG